MIAAIQPRPIIGRVGGKYRLAPWILSHLTNSQWSIWCEPFAGSAAVYFQLVRDGIPDQIKSRGHHFRAVLNDADSRIVQLFKTCRDHPELLAYAVAMTPYSREEHREAQQGIDGIEDEIEQARRYLVDNWQSFKKMVGDSWGIQRQASKNPVTGGYAVEVKEQWQSLPSRILAASPHLQGDTPHLPPIDSPAALNSVGLQFVQPPIDEVSARVELARRYLVDNWQSFKHMAGDSWGIGRNEHDRKSNVKVWDSLSQRIFEATGHLKKCYIENDDAIAVMERWATPHTCFYCDPPYIDSEKYYSHNKASTKEENLELHYRLAETANTIEAATVAISYYPNELLDKLYPEDNWDRYYKEVVASSAGITRNSKARIRPRRTELLLVRKSRNPNAITPNLSGQLQLFS